MIDGYGMLVGELLGIVVIALAAWSLVNLLRAWQLRMQPVAVEIQNQHRVRRDQSW
jgi:hypothetical protein